MEMAKSTALIGVNVLLIFHDILFVIHIPCHFRIMGMIVGKRLLMVMVMVMMMTAASVMVALLIIASGIIFMDMTFPMMMVVAVAAATVVGVYCFFLFIHDNFLLAEIWFFIIRF